MQGFGEARLKIVTMPQDTNPAGNIFGGWIMSQIDLAGAVAAKEIASFSVVTIGVEQMSFKKPIFVGDLVSLYAKIIDVGNTSIKVQVEVFANRCFSNAKEEQAHISSAILTYVNVDKNGEKIKIDDELKKSKGFWLF